MNRKRIGSLIVLLIATPSLAMAGEVFGKIVEGSASVGEAASVEVKCGEKTYPAQKTDKSGSYHVVVAESGKCTLTVSYKNQSASLGIASYGIDTTGDINDHTYITAMGLLRVGMDTLSSGGAPESASLKQRFDKVLKV